MWETNWNNLCSKLDQLKTKIELNWAENGLINKSETRKMKRSKKEQNRRQNKKK